MCLLPAWVQALLARPPGPLQASRRLAYWLKDEAAGWPSSGVDVVIVISHHLILPPALLAAGGLDLDEALSRISGSRGLQVPETSDQVAWVRRIASTFAEPAIRCA